MLKFVLDTYLYIDVSKRRPLEQVDGLRFKK